MLRSLPPGAIPVFGCLPLVQVIYLRYGWDDDNPHCIGPHVLWSEDISDFVSPCPANDIAENDNIETSA